jgi:hypothetical protein
MKRSFPRLLAQLAIALVLIIPAIFVTESFAMPVHPTTASSNLAVFFGYAEDKETNNPPPGAFPVPWSGSPNIVFLGGPVVGQTACGALPLCYDTGAIRLDNSGTSDVTISNVTADIHSSLPGGKVFSLWGSFTVPAGKSVILAENPPNNNPSYDNFDTSGYPKNNCIPITVAPTVAFTINGVSSTVVDSTHILDTGGIDVGSCKPKRNESIPWAQVGSLGVNTTLVTLAPTTNNQFVGKAVTETASVRDGNGNALANTAVAFSVTSGPDIGQSANVVTDSSGNASFTYTGIAAGTDTVVAKVTSNGTFQSNQASVVWTDSSAATWSGADIGSPPLAGSDSLSNGVWTIAGSGRDIGGTADQFHFVWQSLPTDGGIRAKVLTQTNTNSLARAGVMLRQSTDPGSPFYAVVVTSQKGIFVLRRATLAGGVSTVTSLAGVAPAYLQVQRTGSTFTAYTSSDGTTWTLIPGSTLTLSLTGTLLAGMAVTSHTLTTVNTATFNAVSLP